MTATALAPLAKPAAAWLYQGRVARIHGDGDALYYPQKPDAFKYQYRDRAGLQQIAQRMATPKPFTLLHPPDFVGVLVKNGQGDQADVVGRVVGARVDGDHVIADILITDQRGIDAINAGTHELSLGYSSRLDSTKHQRDIEVDHLALVPRARCGSSCTLGLDCAGETRCICNNHAIDYLVERMDPDTTDNVLTAKERSALPHSEFAVPGRQSLPLENADHVRDAMSRFDQAQFQSTSEKHAAFHRIVARAHELGIDAAGFKSKYGGSMDQKEPVMDELQKRLADAMAEAAAAKARVTQLEGEVRLNKDALTQAEVRATNAEAALATANKAVETARVDATRAVAQANADAAQSTATAVTKKVRLLTDANRVLGDRDKDGNEIDRTAMDAIEIQLAVIKHVDGEDLVVGLTDDQKKNPVFVEGVYTGALKRHTAAAASRSGVRQELHANRVGASAAVQRQQDAAPAGAAPLDSEARERLSMINRTRRAQ